MSYLKQTLLVVTVWVVGILLMSLFFPSLVSGPRAFPVPNIDNELLERVWRFHSTHPAFVGRPLTNVGVGMLHEWLGLSIGASFVLVNFPLLFLCGVLVAWCAREFALSVRESLASICIFYSSFTILFAFFRSIDTYDDLWQYAAIFASLVTIRRR